MSACTRKHKVALFAIVVFLFVTYASVHVAAWVLSKSFPLDLSSLPVNKAWVVMRSHPVYNGDVWWNYITGERAIRTPECRIDYTISGQVARDPPFCVKNVPNNYVRTPYNSVDEVGGKVGVVAVVARPLPFTSQDEDLRVLMNISRLIQPLCARKKVCVVRLVRMCCCDEYMPGDQRYPFFVGGWALPAQKNNVVMILSIRIRYALYEGFRSSDGSFTKKLDTHDSHRPHMLRPTGEIIRDVLHELAHTEIKGDSHDEEWTRRFTELRSLYKDLYGHWPEDEASSLL